MSISERAIQAAMMGDLSPGEATDLATIDQLVQRHMFCQGSGKILDSRTAVMIEAKLGDTEQWAIVHPDEKDTAVAKIAEVADRYPGMTFRVVSAAELLAKM